MLRYDAGYLKALYLKTTKRREEEKKRIGYSSHWADGLP